MYLFFLIPSFLYTVIVAGIGIVRFHIVFPLDMHIETGIAGAMFFGKMFTERVSVIEVQIELPIFGLAIVFDIDGWTHIAGVYVVGTHSAQIGRAHV